MTKDIYSFDNYKDYLREVISNSEISWGYISKMADAAGCQRSYLSRSLNSKVHLTMDHAFHIARFLSLNEGETDFFMCLVEVERAATPEYRQKVISRLKQIKEEQLDLHKLSKRPQVNLGEKEFIYYSNWIMSALHIIVSIPEFQTTRAIAEKLQIDLQMAESFLQQLVEFNLIRKEGKKWIFSSGEIHVPKNSPLVHLHHNNWRQRAILDSQKMQTDGIHYTVVQSMDQKAYDEIQNQFLKLIRFATKVAGPAPSKELICMTCDFFKV